MDSTRVVGLFRYPVKGLSPEPLNAVTLAPGDGIPGDRRYAIARGTTRFDPDRPEPLDKTKFLMLMRDERLAALTSFFDEASQTLVLARGQNLAVKACLSNFEARAHLEGFFEHYMGDPAEGRPRIVDAPGHVFSDCHDKVISVVNLNSLRDLCRKTGREIEPLRFRANVYVDGWDAWRELDLIGRDITIGEAQLTVERPIERCAATNVNPLTARRDMNIPKDLMTQYGRNVMGIYARVKTGGAIKLGDAVTEAD
jgi:MOSC domain-containing protein